MINQEMQKTVSDRINAFNDDREREYHIDSDDVIFLAIIPRGVFSDIIFDNGEFTTVGHDGEAQHITFDHLRDICMGQDKAKTFKNALLHPDNQRIFDKSDLILCPKN